MTAVPETHAPVHVCRKCKASKPLVARLEARGVEVELVRCQDICKGAVAGLPVDGQLVWFRRLRTKGDAKRLAKLAERGGAGPVPAKLEPHRASRRDGRPVKRKPGDRPVAQ